MHQLTALAPFRDLLSSDVLSKFSAPSFTLHSTAYCFSSNSRRSWRSTSSSITSSWAASGGTLRLNVTRGWSSCTERLFGRFPSTPSLAILRQVPVCKGTRESTKAWERLFKYIWALSCEKVPYAQKCKTEKNAFESAVLVFESAVHIRCGLRLVFPWFCTIYGAHALERATITELLLWASRR